MNIWNKKIGIFLPDAGLQRLSDSVRIHDILVWIRICLWPMDPDSDPNADPAIFLIDLKDANKKQKKKSFFAYYFFKVHLHHFQS
jgi:hypothetical protein